MTVPALPLTTLPDNPPDPCKTVFNPPTFRVRFFSGRYYVNTTQAVPTTCYTARWV